jgi:murein DD-endopeptidase MepM/ murein hydrolase activator NlpD
MSIRVAGQALKFAAFAGLIVGSASLAGCSTLGMGGGDVTGSIAPQPTSTSGAQAMPQALQPIGSHTQVATGPYTPPENVGNGQGFVVGSAPPGTVSSSALPPLSGSNAMSAQTAYAPLATTTATLAEPPTTLKAMQQGVYYHVIQSGESLYTIARHYDITAEAIISANGLSSADKIFVGQRIIIPGRADLLASMDKPIPGGVKPVPVMPIDPTKTAEITPVKPLPSSLTPPSGPTATSQPATQVATAEPMPPKVPAVDPQLSGADKFRWPVSGKVITDFLASNKTGIDIDAPAGSAVRAAENGTVIYVGSGVEGYGNLILIRHPNGYVSAYAHLASTSVVKGQTINRGDSIGAVGMTGSVSRPELHFELRMGATPVDPVPLLAG